MVRPGVDERATDHVHEHAPTEPVLTPDAPPARRRGLGAAVAPWVTFFAVGVVVAIALFVWLLARGRNGDEGVAPIPPGTSEAEADAVADEPDVAWFRSRTVNVDDGQDLMALASNPAALAEYHGAPITADAVVVNEVFGTEAFTILSPTGQEMLVYVAPVGGSDFVSVATGQEIAFIGTLMPVQGDFQFLVGTAAAPEASPAGAYLSAVPQTLEILPPEQV